MNKKTKEISPPQSAKSKKQPDNSFAQLAECIIGTKEEQEERVTARNQAIKVIESVEKKYPIHTNITEVSQLLERKTQMIFYAQHNHRILTDDEIKAMRKELINIHKRLKYLVPEGE